MRSIAILVFSAVSVFGTVTAHAKCTGFADMCSFVGSMGEFECQQQRGCYWSPMPPGPGQCSGFANSCDEMFDEGSCFSQHGCTWQITPDRAEEVPAE